MNEKQIISECRNETIIELVEMIGIEKTLELTKKLGGTQLYIPKFKNLAKDYRDNEIYYDYQIGMSYKAVACKYGLSEVSVRSIVNIKRKGI